MELCSLLISSALVLQPVQTARFNSVEYFDQKIQVTERVLDRSICKDIDRVQDVDQVAFKTYTDDQKRIAVEAATERKRRNRLAVSAHCRASTRILTNKAAECNMER